MFIAVYYRVIFILSPVSFFNLTILYRQGLFLSTCFLAFLFLHKKRGRLFVVPALVYMESVCVLRNYYFLCRCPYFNHIESARECYLVVAAYCRNTSDKSSACGIYIG